MDWRLPTRLASAQPDNADWQRSLAVSYGHLGDVYRRANDAEKAEAALREGQAIMQRVVEARAGQYRLEERPRLVRRTGFDLGERIVAPRICKGTRRAARMAQCPQCDRLQPLPSDLLIAAPTDASQKLNEINKYLARRRRT